MRHVNGIFLKKQNKYKNTGQTHIIFYYSLLANYGFCLQLAKGPCLLCDFLLGSDN